MNDALKAKKLSSEHFICEFCYSLTSSEDNTADCDSSVRLYLV